MSELLDRINHQRPAVIQSCVGLIENEVSSKRGMMSIPLKAGYKVLKGVKPGFVGHCVDFLLDDFCQAMEPYFQTWSAQDPATRGGLDRQLSGNQEQVSEALLGVTDVRAQRSTNRALKSLYSKLRPKAKEHVKAALPGVGRTLEPYVRNPATS
ncbi:MAG: hypothetical protein KDD82_27425 [Planctomycetes bacterium]|nr:hypothetical protein [Planctomycetota bacterium]